MCTTGLAYWAGWEIAKFLWSGQKASHHTFSLEWPLSSWERPVRWQTWGPRWPDLLELGRSLVLCFAGFVELLFGALVGLVQWLVDYLRHRRLLRSAGAGRPVPLAIADMAAALPIGGAGLAAVAGAPAGGIAQNSFCMIPSDDQTEYNEVFLIQPIPGPESVNCWLCLVGDDPPPRWTSCHIDGVARMILTRVTQVAWCSFTLR